jgi:hypothetical protein
MPRSTASRSGPKSRLTKRAPQNSAQLPMPSHPIPGADSAGSAVGTRAPLRGRRVNLAIGGARRCERGSLSRSWSCDVGLASIAAANCANRGPLDAHSTCGPATLSSDRGATPDRLLGGSHGETLDIGVSGSWSRIASRPARLEAAPIALAASLTRVLGRSQLTSTVCSPHPHPAISRSTRMSRKPQGVPYGGHS